ncbi:hypothetical protein [Marinomonas pollencensis]|uniref:Uncharacterized protein n=1 Tax=Marinomonas pollencensis TaxID=491954 RepID=A0A3E0DRQ2_9GAMM|nr:hypothetical protein [Marinomonas pollencensis]REG85738.1 hypothetical protein DFP81_102271 [Marinomonas pollencensis]
MSNIVQQILALFFILFMSSASWAECSDFEATKAADKVAEKYLKGKIFQRAEVLKVHSPSKRKEIASYVKSDALYYTIFSLVNSQCKVQIIKRTQGKH